MPDLPTCWYCPECGWSGHRIYGSAHVRPDWDGSLIPPEIEAGCCRTPLVEATIVPPAPTPEQRRAALGILGYDVEYESSAPANDCERWSFQGNYCIEGADCACIALRPAYRIVLRDQRETTDA